jgi:hypothetical protein
MLGTGATFPLGNLFFALFAPSRRIIRFRATATLRDGFSMARQTRTSISGGSRNTAQQMQQFSIVCPSF